MRHAGGEERGKQAPRQAQDAYRKDVVALMGLDIPRTAETWLNPDKATCAYWFKDILNHRAADLGCGQHSCAAALLQLGGQLDRESWDEGALVDWTRAWFEYRRKDSMCQRSFPELEIEAKPLAPEHWVVISEWQLRFEVGQSILES